MDYKRGFKRVALVLTVAYGLGSIGFAMVVSRDAWVTTRYAYYFQQSGRCYSVLATHEAEALGIVRAQHAQAAPTEDPDNFGSCQLVNYAPDTPREVLDLGTGFLMLAVVLGAALAAYLAACATLWGGYRLVRWIIEGFGSQGQP